MEVIDRDTAKHAVLGGGSPETASLADTAEFYAILYAGIYSDGRTAMVREIICNAHDAHIQAGIPDTPVSVTITDEHFIVSDQGPGIPRNKMRKNYMTFGASTKLDDAAATGGFGLGSKAPWAYSDHFTVISECDGERVIYAASKGSLESGGRPEIRPMAVTKSTKTGLTVKVPIRGGGGERAAIERIAEKIIRTGNINATLNEVTVPTWDYEGIGERGYWGFYDPRSSALSVYIKIATVLYPLPDNDEITEVRRRLTRAKLSATLVLEDPDNAIKPTPSRETVNATPNAVKRILKLLKVACHDAEALRGELSREFTKAVAFDRTLPRAGSFGSSNMGELLAASFCIAPEKEDLIREKGKHDRHFQRVATSCLKLKHENRRAWKPLARAELRASRGDVYRIMRRAGVDARAYTASQSTTARKIEKSPVNTVKHGVIYLARRVKDFERALRQSMRGFSNARFGMIHPNPGEHHDRIREEAARLGWIVVYCGTREAPERPKFQSKVTIVSDVTRSCNTRAEAFEFHKAEGGVKPKAYVEIRRLKEGYTSSDGTSVATLRLAAKTLGEVALCANKTAVNAMKKEGIPHVKEAMAKKVRAILSTPSAKARMAIEQGSFYIRKGLGPSVFSALPECLLSCLGLPPVYDEDTFNVAKDYEDLLLILPEKERLKARNNILRDAAERLGEWLIEEGVTEAILASSRLKNAELKSKLLKHLENEITTKFKP